MLSVSLLCHVQQLKEFAVLLRCIRLVCNIHVFCIKILIIQKYQLLILSILFSFISEFERTFNGEDWGSNGPGVITRVLQSVCHTNVVDSMDLKHCRGFQVYPPSSFYAIPWPRWRWFFDPKETLKTLEMTKNSPVIHVWNKHSIKEKIRVGSKVAYGIVAQHNCPAVYSTCGEYF